MLGIRFFVILIAGLFSQASLSRYKVCSITINSADEIQVFKEQLNPEDFDFVELVEDDPSETWFQKACLKDHKCDVLLISGHFAGIFFGKTGNILPIQDLEQQACSGGCPGILSHAKEVFLFGCNTLSGKEKDSRDYASYLEVLLDDGMAREVAERVVSARYSPLENSFEDRMKFVFSGSESIYGFETLSPLGHQIQPFLRQYLQDIKKTFGSYSAYLDSKAYLKKNSYLFKQAGRFSLNQVHAGFKTEDEKDIFLKKCQLYSADIDVDKKADVLKKIFRDDKQILKAFFAIDHVLDQHHDELLSYKKGSLLREIKNKQSYKKKFQKILEKLNYLPYVKIVYLNFLSKLNWLDDNQDLDKEIHNQALNIIQRNDSESFHVISLLVNENHIKSKNLYFSKSDLPKNYKINLWSLLIFEKLQITSPDLQDDVYDFCIKNLKTNKPLCWQALNTLSFMKPTKKIVKKLEKTFLNHNDSSLIYYALKAIGQSQTKDFDLHMKISNFLYHDDIWVRKEALRALALLRTSHSAVQKKLAQFLYKSTDENRGEVLSHLSQINITELDLKEAIINLSWDGQSWELLQKSLLAFSSTIKPDEKIVQFFIDVLQLNNPQITQAVLDASYGASIQSSRFDQALFENIQQLGLNLQIQALKKLETRLWLDKEVQAQLVEFANSHYNGEIKLIVDDILRNLENN